MNMRERIARALWTELPDCTRYDDLHPNIRATYLKRADAVLDAIVDATPTMLAIALPNTGNPSQAERALGAEAAALLHEEQPTGMVIAAEMARDWRNLIVAARNGA